MNKFCLCFSKRECEKKIKENKKQKKYENIKKYEKNLGK